MKTRVLSSEMPEALAQAIAILQSGGLVAYPTDTVYGLAAPAFSYEGIDRLFEAKDRNPGKAIAILIGDSSQLPQVAINLPEIALVLASKYWPGALTLVVARHPDLPNRLAPLPTIGVRMPDHEFARELLRRAGPLATSSANLSGGPNPLNAQDVLTQLEGRFELLIDGGTCPGGVPSTVVDCTTTPPTILREGAILSIDIQKLIRP